MLIGAHHDGIAITRDRNNRQGIVKGGEWQPKRNLLGSPVRSVRRQLLVRVLRRLPTPDITWQPQSMEWATTRCGYAKSGFLFHYRRSGYEQSSAFDAASSLQLFYNSLYDTDVTVFESARADGKIG